MAAACAQEATARPVAKAIAKRRVDRAPWAWSVSRSEPATYQIDAARSCVADYPATPPTEADELRLRDDYRRVVCPGCSDAEVELGVCHGKLLCAHLATRLPSSGQPLAALGLQELSAEEFKTRVDDATSLFVGRRPPRGVPTKSAGVRTTLSRSKFANPFVVSMRAFTLNESLALYRLWVEGGYRRLSDSAVRSVCVARG
jgi:hypothetical protein